jgi:hypothetical protein
MCVRVADESAAVKNTHLNGLMVQVMFVMNAKTFILSLEATLKLSKHKLIIIIKRRIKMPCDSITTQSVKLSNAMPNILTDALTILGWTIQLENKSIIKASKNYNTFEWTKGKGIQISGMGKNESELNAITKQYSKRAVSWAAQRAGWNVQSTGENTLTVNRR